MKKYESVQIDILTFSEADIVRTSFGGFEGEGDGFNTPTETSKNQNWHSV